MHEEVVDSAGLEDAYGNHTSDSCHIFDIKLKKNKDLLNHNTDANMVVHFIENRLHRPIAFPRTAVIGASPPPHWGLTHPDGGLTHPDWAPPEYIRNSF